MSIHIGPSQLAPVTVAVALMFVSRAAFATWPHDPSENVPVVQAVGNQSGVRTIPDGSGGLYVGWLDQRAGNYDVYLQHVLADGSRSPTWPATGLPVGSGPGNQTPFDLSTDGSGGALVVWGDSRGANIDVYGSRILADGSLPPGWGGNGNLIIGFAGTQTNPVVCPDGLGGMFCAWEDFRAGASDVYLQHLTDMAQPWVLAPAGMPVCTAAGSQNNLAIGADGSNGVNLAWADFRNAADYNIMATRITIGGAAAAGWVQDGVPICMAAGNQTNPVMLVDGAGGAYLSWKDNRGADADVYIRGINGGGVPVWLADGVPLCTVAGDQTNVRLAAYGDGVIAAWQDARVPATSAIVVQAITNYGVVTPDFPANGVSVASSGVSQLNPVVAEDGVGGVFFAWQEPRYGAYDVFAQRFGPDYRVYPGWPLGGLRVTSAPGSQAVPSIVATNPEILVAAWADFRGADYDVYAQRIDRFGRLGQPEAAIAGVHDVKLDQGGHVRLDWTPSYLDATPLFEIGSYAVWRQAPAAAALRALRAGARLVQSGGEAAASDARAFRVTGTAAAPVYWEYLVSLKARGLQGYSYTVATNSDSTAAGNPYTQFMIEADASGTIAFWMSNPDSGYSVDNLAPAPATSFTAQYFAGGSPAAAGHSLAAQSQPYTWLHWGVAGEADVAEYRIYRGSSANFVPSQANFVAAKPDTGYIDAGAPPSYYKLVTVDTHGNASVAAAALPANLLGVGNSPGAGRVAFLPPSPNPAHEGCVFRIELPAGAPSRLELFDAAGRRVRDLAAGVLGAGVHEIPWDGRDARGQAAAPGLYYARFTGAGAAIAREVVVLGR
jgi:hypothetical protein